MFLIFRHQFTTVQGILTEEPDQVSQIMVRWAEGIARESIVLVEGVIQRPPPNQENVHSTTIHEYEIKIQKVSVTSLFAKIPRLTTYLSCMLSPRLPRPCRSRLKTSLDQRNTMKGYEPYR